MQRLVDFEDSYSDTESSDEDEDNSLQFISLVCWEAGKAYSFQDGGMQPLREDMTTFVLDETIASGTLGIVAVRVYQVKCV